MQTLSYPPIADYGLIGDMRSCALVSRTGSIDWCCLPRFDSPSVFGRLLDWHRGGYFLLAPRGVRKVSRRYFEDTNVLETTFVAEGGMARLVDFMPVPLPGQMGAEDVAIVRVLECVKGAVHFLMECQPRFDYGRALPHLVWDGPCTAFAHGGADGLAIYCSAPMSADDGGVRAGGLLREGQKVWAAVRYHLAFSPGAIELDPQLAEAWLQKTISFWRGWASRCTYGGPYREEVVRSALVLKALTYAPSGALLAAATTSLPAVMGGRCNWDYRFTWVRDATFALYALSLLGYREEVEEFKRWLERATFGRASDLQVLYGPGGERHLPERRLPHLEGYRGSRPVRVGNEAHAQFQLDIYGELLDSAHIYRRLGGQMDPDYWNFLRDVVEFVIGHWYLPDNGIWELRGERRHYVFSKVMCWVALDRAIKAAMALGLPADLERWTAVRDRIRAEVLERGFDRQRGAFVQAYGSKALDAAALLFPLVKFIPATDPRMISTVRAIQRELTSPQGLVYRFRQAQEAGEGAFFICSFWLVDNLIMLGEREEAEALFRTILSYANDLGLFSEQVDPTTGEMRGNFPQAFSHLGLISSAVNLEATGR